MAFHITVLPSGRGFDAEPMESLLQAGLRAGLNLVHGCANGRCGECRARLVSGHIEAVRHADFSLSERDRGAGHFLLCSQHAASDLVIEAQIAGDAAEIPAQTVRAKVSRIDPLHDDVIQLTVRTPRSAGLRFLAGQGVALDFAGLEPRVLPIASCPCDTVQLRFHVRRLANPFSEFVFERLRKGTEVTLRGPCGDFTLDEGSTRPLVLVAWETGFAPVASLIDHAIQKDINRSIDLYWLSGFPGGHYQENYCRAWRDVLDDFRYHAIDLAPGGGEGIADVVARVVRVHSMLADHDYYLALPDTAVDAVRGVLADAEVPDAQVRISAMIGP